ncbi:MAG: DUF2723 domain-containing protein [Mucinivorans sp.]
MTKFRKLSIIGGWVVFAIAMITYMLTLEPTASLWDCPEFIATSYKLEVGHPPGTPLFFLINRLGAMFAGAPENVGYAINTLSALESALTIAFLFWTIAHLARKIYRKTADALSSHEVWVTMAAATIGSLAYAFTDTFWFSAVEGEVYALSSLFTAAVLWAMLRWESVADEKGSNRWLVLIAYLMGLSIGAHILNLLTIPALVFIYYFKKYPASPHKSLWKPAAVGILLTGFFYMLTPTVVSIGAWVDRIFVNGFGFAVNSGLTTFVVLLLVLLGFFAYRAQKQGHATLNTVLVSVGMIIIGFSTYGVVLIRSSVNPPMNSNHPDNPYSLVQFLSREQYGSSPLLYGRTYASPVVDYVENDSYYVDSLGKYKPYKYAFDYVADPATTMFFPRMHSRDHAEQYKAWSDIKGRKVRSKDGEMITVPTFAENMRFFISYQVNHMYWRYFMWNFVGRQTDVQNDGLVNGNWLSGIKPLDALYLGPQDNLPQELANIKGRNHYFYLPFILGLIGFFFQLKKEGRGFLIVTLLFFMTGVAIILYLNQTPSQPRERDYAYAASFYAFAIWIGLGLMGVVNFMHNKVFRKKNAKAALAVGATLCLSVPVILAQQNWDDHDRSARTIANDMGVNYLTNLLPNSILINYGDNDTFPVWYAQEVLGERPDVRVMNNSYISGDWYVDQMRIKSNEGEALPISLPQSKYKAQSSPLFFVNPTPHPYGGVWTIKEVMQVVNSEDPSTKVRLSDGNFYDFVPAKRIAIPVNKDNVLRSGIVKASDAHLIEDTVWVEIKSQTIGLGDMILLDMLATSDWTRPIYFTSSSGSMDLGLTFTTSDGESFSYLQMDGAVFRLVPIKTKVAKRLAVGRIDTDLLYDNLMNKYSYGGVKNGVYVDQFVANTLVQTQFRTAFARLADGLMAEGDTARAVEVLDRAMIELPVEQLRRDEALVGIIEGYWRAGQKVKGDALADDYYQTMMDYLNYYNRFKGVKAKSVEDYMLDVYNNLYYLYRSANSVGQKKYTEKLAPYFSSDK